MRFQAEPKDRGLAVSTEGGSCQLPVKMPMALHGAGMVRSVGGFMLCGGSMEDGEPNDKCWRYWAKDQVKLNPFNSYNWLAE